MHLVTYDLDAGWDETKANCIRAGFRDFIVLNNGRTAPLPNTSLLVPASSPEEALAKFEAVVANTSPFIRVTRAVAFNWSTASVTA